MVAKISEMVLQATAELRGQEISWNRECLFEKANSTCQGFSFVSFALRNPKNKLTGFFFTPVFCLGKIKLSYPEDVN